jgi:hypothetical protein
VDMVVALLPYGNATKIFLNYRVRNMSWVQKLFNKNFVNCCETEGIIIYSQNISANFRSQKKYFILQNTNQSKNI